MNSNLKKIPPEIFKKIKKFHIKSMFMVNSIVAGQHKSIFRGSGIEFEEVRDYFPGDDVKSIDWKTSARMGRPFVKLYREERDLNIMIFVDLSASGYFGTNGKLKIETAVEIASVLAFNAIRNNDKIGAILFTDSVEKYIPLGKGTSHVFNVIKEILSFAPQQKGTDIVNAVAFFQKVCIKKSILFLISDFISDNFVRQLKICAAKHELVGIIVSDPGEFSLPGTGILSFQDPETGEQAFLDLKDKKTCKLFKEKRLKQYRKNLNIFKTAGIDCIEINTDGSVTGPLIKYFENRGKRVH